MASGSMRAITSRSTCRSREVSHGPYGVKSVEVVKVTATADGSKPPYQVIFSAYFESAAGLQSAMQSPRIGEVLGDIQNFYDGMPDVLIGEVVALPAPA
jgi:uncharacterized protein (TIGR02118 family)